MITPSDSPSAPERYAGVPVSGTDIQAPQEDLAGAYDAAGAVTGAGIVYPVAPRQGDTEALLKSPPGYQDFDIYPGFSGEGSTTHGWPNDVGPPDGD